MRVLDFSHATGPLISKTAPSKAKTKKAKTGRSDVGDSRTTKATAFHSRCGVVYKRCRQLRIPKNRKGHYGLLPLRASIRRAVGSGTNVMSSLGTIVNGEGV